MIFPYISQIQVNNCFAAQGLFIPKDELSEFKHIILTGKNGSGKTTILKRIAFLVTQLRNGKTKIQGINNLQGIIQANLNHPSRPEWEKQVSEYNDLDLKYIGDLETELTKQPENYIFSFFQASRKIEVAVVDTVTIEDEFLKHLKNDNTTENFVSKFKQYLVNKKVYEAFDYINNKFSKTNQSKNFFDNLTDTLRSIFEDDELELEFVQENFEFYLKLKDGRRVTFNNLSDGFSAFLSIIMDLFVRTDLLRKSKNDYSFEPEGIVLIDEPETHFHLSMQYEILPLINRLFPKIQLVIATHSPAIISSIKNAVVYDLTSREEVSDWILGSSYSELMIAHFGLDNEFSNVADKILDELNIAVKDKNLDKLRSILFQNEKYLTPSLRLEIESHIIDIENQSER